MVERDRGPVKFEIIKHIGVLNTAPTGWSKEFNIVRWNDKSEKYDVRDWSPGHERMSRGVTMYEDELKKLFEFCSDIFVADSDSENDSDDQKSPRVEGMPEQMANKVAEHQDEEIPF